MSMACRRAIQLPRNAPDRLDLVEASPPVITATKKLAIFSVGLGTFPRYKTTELENCLPGVKAGAGSQRHAGFTNQASLLDSEGSKLRSILRPGLRMG